MSVEDYVHRIFSSQLLEERTMVANITEEHMTNDFKQKTCPQIVPWSGICGFSQMAGSEAVHRTDSIHCELSGFHRGMLGVFALLGCYAALVCSGFNF
jgi:hypothetical protein